MIDGWSIYISQYKKNRFVAIFLKSQVNPLKQKGNKILNAKNRKALSAYISNESCNQKII